MSIEAPRHIPVNREEVQEKLDNGEIPSYWRKK
jgi:sRNA-binding carbon storage regulator CsrA